MKKQIILFLLIAISLTSFAHDAKEIIKKYLY